MATRKTKRQKAGAAAGFAAVLDAVDQLTAEEQEELTQIVRRRLAERGRQRILREVLEAERELATGVCRRATADEIMDEILS